ncbi:GGDEF domain-containing protein [Glaciecola siphonariae]|uniref:diguanylate cyclase n=1 Tax=Glaciecola siphonariae TaxID=521012 RepID=A0ABV9LZU1_9ALTE
MNLPYSKNITIASFLILLLQVDAHAGSDIDDFLSELKTVTYDCPNPVHLPKLDEILDSNDLSTTERFRLLVNKTHFQNCNGQFDQAQATLKDIINHPQADESSEYFASATYQLGFTYDVQENNERCVHYAKAYSLSRDKFEDIEMSSALGLITNCKDSGYSNDSERIAAYFALIEQYASSENKRALAHIHNSVGLFFGKREQHVLAAEQYLKAHEMGKDVYTGSNRLSILISAITSLFGSGQFERAYQAIEEFGEINQDVGTPLTNFWYHYVKAGYYYRVNDIDSLETTLPLLKSSLDKINGKFYQSLYNWYSAVPCLERKNLVCLQNFVDAESKIDQASKQYDTYDYYKFLVRAYFALGDLDAASEAYEKSLKKLDQIKQNHDGFSKIMSVANLYGKIYVLENEIVAAERRKARLLIGAVIVVFLGVIALAIILRKRHIARMSLDPSTQLLNSKTAVTEILKVMPPSKGKINALAIFDLGNFREVNRQIGSTKGDYVLQKIASTLSKVTRSNDILGRFAPEQFILCLTDIEEDSAKSFFERVQQALEATFIDAQHGVDISIRSSMSIYITGEKFNDLNRILDDMLLSLSIKSGK